MGENVTNNQKNFSGLKNGEPKDHRSHVSHLNDLKNNFKVIWL